VIRRPRLIPSLADTSTDDDDRRTPDEYVSLVLLWLIVGVVPGIPMIASDQGPQWIAHAVLANLGIEASIVAAAALLLLAPVSFATAQCIVNRRPLARSTLRRPFTMQCGCFAPLLLGYFAGLAASHQSMLTSYEGIYAAVSYVLLGGSLFWFVAAEYIVLRLDGDGRPARALAAMGIGLLLWAGLIAASRLVLLLVSVYY
jgi:hypothetical protein